MRRFVLYLLLLSFPLCAAELPQPLKLLPDILEGLLKLDPSIWGFHAVPFRESIRANSTIETEDIFFEDKGVIVAEELFESFCNKQRLSAPAISPIIHMIWLGSSPTLPVQLAMTSWQKYHPNWEVRLWTDKEVQELVWSHPRSEFLFEHAKNWAEKSDILRFEILYQYGGIYADTDAVCLKPLTSLADSGLSFFAGFEENKIKLLGRPLIGSAVIGSAKNHPILHRCIDYSFTQIEQPQLKQHIRSGPGPISKACYEALESEQKDILILPCSYLYPLPWNKRSYPFEQILENIRPESFAIHLWEGSWFQTP